MGLVSHEALDLLVNSEGFVREFPREAETREVFYPAQRDVCLANSYMISAFRVR